jgi:hypothetical protein
MLKNFNAVNEKWIPVISPIGSELASLKDIFNSSSNYISFSDGAWGGLPYLNLLIVIATDACRPQTVEDIQSYLDDQDAFFKTVNKYLIKHTDRFNLFDRNPFLQIGCYDFNTLKLSEPEHIRDAEDMLLKEGETTSDLRGGAQVHLDCEAKIVQALLKSLVYGGNKKTLIKGNARPNLTDSSGKIVGSIEKGQPEVSPILTTNSGSSGTINIFVQGSDLIQTIVLNLISEDVVKQTWVKGFGCPIYLSDTNDHNNMVSNHEELDHTFLGHLVPLIKYLRILTDAEAIAKKLDPKKVWIIYNHAVAYDFKGALENLKKSVGSDKHYYTELSNPKAKYTRGILKPNSYLWKEFAEFNLKLIPKVLEKFIALKANNTTIINAVGMECSGTAGLVYNEKLYESNLTLEKGVINDYMIGGFFFQILQNMGKVSFEISSKLYCAVISYAKDLYGDKCDCDPYTDEALRFYWEMLNNHSRYFIAKAQKNAPRIKEDWEEFCKETARDILRGIKDGSVRRNKAIAKALLIIK